MRQSLPIEEIFAREIIDSRGNPTVEVEVMVKGGVTGRASVPSGASTGSFEAVELRDKDNTRFLGKGVLNAVDNVNEVIYSEIIGKDVFKQRLIDETMVELDGTKNKGKLGANAMLGVSLSVARAAAKALGIPVYRYLGGVNANILPMPMMNILNGGKHADNNVNIQEFMIVPVGAETIKERIRMGTEVFHNLKSVLKEKGYSTSVGDEGGFAPNLEKDEDAFDVIIEAIKKAGYSTETDIKIAIDVAASEMYDDGKYNFWKSKINKNTDEMIDYWEELIRKYPIISIEDGLAEDDWESWKKLTDRIGDKVQLVGDDLFVTNPERLSKGIKLGIANAILIKPNQIGTLTETLDVIEMAKKAGYGTIISHRSGETEDTFVADLSVAVNSGQIKTGAPSRTDRVCKYNQLIRIEENLS